MANPDAIVGRIDRIEPLGAGDAPAKKPIDRESIVHFDKGESARLSPAGPMSEAYARALDDLWATRDPVYVEVDASGTINRLLLPISATVKSLAPTPAGEVEVELERSHAVRVLKPETPFFEEMLSTLTRAREEGSGVLVTETPDDHVIIDVREAAGPFEPEEEEDDPALDFSSLRAIDPDRARRLFEIVEGKKCDTSGLPASCIPFLYPDDGCWARAHAMYFAILDEGEDAGKVWFYYNRLRYISTPNHPYCRVPWAWHVVPVLRVTMGDGPQPWVIDPSLFDGPVHLDTWLMAQGGTFGTTLLWTAPWVFYRDSKIGPVPGGKNDIEGVLRGDRRNLLLRSHYQNGPPPYGYCL